MWAIYWQTFHLTKGVLWDQEREERDVAQENKKDRAVKKNDKNRARGEIRKMAGKQQRDYWGEMSRRGDVRYTVSCGDKDDQLLTPPHFNCQNKKLVQASCVLFSLEKTGQTMSSQQHETYISWEGRDGMSRCEPFYLKHVSYAVCVGAAQENNPQTEREEDPL